MKNSDDTSICDNNGLENDDGFLLNNAERIVEAILFASAHPISSVELRKLVDVHLDLEHVISSLSKHYAERGVNLVHVADGWVFRTAPDLAFLFSTHVSTPKKISRAAMETLAIIAYHQPITRAEIEEFRGVSSSRGSLDLLIETGWVHIKGRRRSPGKPVTYGTTPAFLEHFNLGSLEALPGIDELKGAGFFDPPTDLGESLSLFTDDALSQDSD